MLFKKIDRASGDAVSSSLDLFSLPDTNVTAAKSIFREYLTLNPVSDPPFHFKIHAGSGFVDLSRCYLLTQLHLEVQDATTRTWSPIKATDKANVIQGIGATFMENLKISLNGRETYNR